MTQRILMVDDEVLVLEGLRRNLHGRYVMDTATSGAEGLTLVAGTDDGYAVVVSDMTMPGMNGAEFLARTREVSPDTIQIVLSGQAELSSTIAAVNNGGLFRFLTKPCEANELARAIDAGLAQYRLVHSERELLERTLDGAVQVLTELMSAASPVAFARTERVKALTDAVATAVPVTSTWELRMAAMLGQIGLMAVPEEVLDRIGSGADVDAETRTMYRSHPRLSYDLIRRIPRLERVADWVAGQPVSFDDATGPPPATGDAAGAAVPDEDGGTGRSIYTTVMAFVVGAEAGLAPAVVAQRLARAGRYPAEMVEAARHAYERTTVRRRQQVGAGQLRVGMLVNQDVVTNTGLTLVRGGEILTESMAIRLQHFARGVGVVEPIDVSV